MLENQNTHRCVSDRHDMILAVKMALNLDLKNNNKQANKILTNKQKKTKQANQFCRAIFKRRQTTK